jgi:hypothetical protein
MTWGDPNAQVALPGTEEDLRARLARYQVLSLIIGLVALGITIVAAFANAELREPFYRAYLVAFLFWMGLALGSGGIVMIHNLSGGRWGPAARRVLLAANGNVPLMAVLAIPLGIAIHTQHIYGWAGFGPDPHLGPHKTLWLTPSAVTIRGIVYLVVWIATCIMVRIGAARVEATRSFAVASTFAGLSAFGLIFYVLTLTGTVVDWVMSITPEWYSTMFTLIFLMGQVLSAFCFATLVTSLLIRFKPVAGKISKDQFNDLASFMFAFTVLWAYMSFSQLIITYMGNLKSEMAWYVHRNNTGWLPVGLGLMLLQFLVPFLLLMNKPLKRNPRLLVWVAFWILLMRLMDLLYLIKPAMAAPQLTWMDALTPFGIGGLFMWGFLGRLKAGKLEPPPLVDEYSAIELGSNDVGATEYGAAITGRKGPIP